MNPFSVRLMLCCLSLVAVTAIAVDHEVTPVEAARAAAGLIALWAPASLAVYCFARGQFAGIVQAATFSAISGYAITTLMYFALAVVGIWVPYAEACFPLLQVSLLAGSLWHLRHAWRTADWLPVSRGFQCIDWKLVFLLAAGNLTVSRYQEAFEIDPSRPGAHRFVSDGDQTYFASIVYELNRGVPARQQSIQAGKQDRAYHMFPHLTVLLISRCTGQSDVLRASMLYHYSVVVPLMSLALYSITTTFTRSRKGGYVSVALLYILAIPLPRLIQGNSREFLYCTLYPHATSTIEPVLMTSPQGMSGLLVMYGVLLGMAQLSVTVSRGRGAGSLPVVLGVLIASLVRFRVNMFLPVFPFFMMVLAVNWWRTRRPVFAVAAGVSLVLSVLLILEMRLPIYLPETSSMQIGNSYLTIYRQFAWLNAWPFAEFVFGGIGALPVGDAAKIWIWQILSLTMFVAFNMLGIPMCWGLVVYYRTRRAWESFRTFTLFGLWLVVSTVIGAVCLITPNDHWSLGGQMLGGAGAFAFPSFSIGVWIYWIIWRRRWHMRASTSGLIFWLVVGGAIAWQLIRPPTLLETNRRGRGIAVSRAEWEAFAYLHDRLPQDSVILFNNHAYPRDVVALVSGVGGRRAYYEYVVGAFADGQWRADSGRLQDIAAIWNAASPDTLCHLLRASGVTHVLESSLVPLAIHPADCLQREWTSSDRQMTIWSVRRESPGESHPPTSR